MARPVIYNDDTKFCVRPTGDSKLQKHSDRRAIVDLMLDNGGCMTLREVETHFGFPMRLKVIALVRAGWLSLHSGDQP